MVKVMKIFIIFLASCSSLGSYTYANTVLATFDASIATSPTTQGWNDYTNGQASGAQVQDLGGSSWQANGTGGRAQWIIYPSTQNNNDAAANGWKMSWTSRVESGTFITDYYSNGAIRFLPILSINSGGDLMVTLAGGGMHTLESGSGASDYHEYVVEFNATTNLATFSFDGVVIDSAWAGEASNQNIIAWGNGSTGTDSIAYYKNVSFVINGQPSSANIVSQWDTSALTFDGSSQFSEHNSDVALVQDLTRGSIYTHFKATGTTATIFSTSNSAVDSNEFALLINGDGTLRIHARDNGVFINDAKTVTTYNNNQEHKALIMVSSSGTKIYVDGKLEFTGSSTNFISSVTGLDSLNIGRNYDNKGGQWYFSGEIYDTRVYNNVMSDEQAEELTSLSVLVASFDSSVQSDPVDAGWINDASGSGSGSLITEQGQSAWQANGTGGRAEWEIEPTLQAKNDASNFGWVMKTTSRIVSGSAISDYYANGTQRFIVLLSINANGDLIADLEGGGSYTLVSTTGADYYHDYEVSYDVSTEQATFSFDGEIIETWPGATTNQNVIVWGNGSSGSDGIANYRKVSFETFGSGSNIFESIVFEGGQEGVDGTSNYRIPSMVQAADGSLLAFIEGRPSGADPGQAGQINISLKRSTDMGRTWLPVQVIHENPAFDYSDPRPFLDKTTNAIYVFYVQWPDLCAQNGDCVGPNDPNYIFYRKSADNGVTWEAPIDVTSQVKDPTWRSINPGPGQGIQLQWQTAIQGNHNGRLIFPAIVRAGNSNFYVATIFSDNNGVSWQKGNFTPVSGPTEADMVELNNGTLLLSARNDGGSAGTRYHFLSDDGGNTWIQTTHDLAVSKVDIGLTRYSAVRSGDVEDRIVVSAPMGTSAGPNRNNLAIWSSFDEGATFGAPHQLVYGKSAYSDIVTLNDGSIGIIYEATDNTLIKFINVELDEIK